MYSFMDMIEKEHGSINEYFTAIGIDEETQTVIRRKLI